MNTSGRILSGLTLCVALFGCATKSEVVSLGGNTYSVTRKATTAFGRDTDEMTAKAKEDAAQYCAAQGKELKVLDVVVDKPFYTTGYASSKVVFKAVNPEKRCARRTGSDRGQQRKGFCCGKPEASHGRSHSELTNSILRKKGILTG